MSELDCKYVSSRGILKSCDITYENPISSTKELPDLDKIYDKCSLYVCNSAILNLSKQLDYIKHNFILVSGDADEENSGIFETYDEFIQFIENDKIIHWFCQNSTVTHNKITKLPIGMDYHTLASGNHSWGNQQSPIDQEKDIIKNNTDRIHKGYINFKYPPESYTYASDRIDALNYIPDDITFKETDAIKRKDSWKNQVKYSFVVSPFGNGLDCHRTWEALVLGCYPIVKTSGINELYDGLPVLIVNDWRELNQSLLDKTIEQYKDKKFNYDKLLLEYWVNKINSYKKVVVEGYCNKSTPVYILFGLFIIAFFIYNNIYGVIALFASLIYICYDKSYESMTNSYNYNVIFAGTVRNVEPYIKKTLDNIDKCGQKFNSYAVVIYENDSTDATRKILLDNKKDNYYYIFEDNVTETRRTMRLANGRNKILDKVKQLKGYHYLVMLDMDDINASGKFVDSIETSFKYDDWNVLAGNQTGNYYDIWALRQPGYIDYDCWKDHRGDETQKIIEGTHYESKGLIPVKSAFGGIAIYKIDKIGECKYVGEYADGTEQCEHVEFHKCIKNVFINTDFYTS